MREAVKNGRNGFPIFRMKIFCNFGLDKTSYGCPFLIPGVTEATNVTHKKKLKL